jgi:hypothetical protein
MTLMPQARIMALSAASPSTGLAIINEIRASRLLPDRSAFRTRRFVMAAADYADSPKPCAASSSAINTGLKLSEN